METISELLANCTGNPSVTGGFLEQRIGNPDLWCLFDVRLNKIAEQKLEWPVIWDAMTLVLRHYSIQRDYFFGVAPVLVEQPLRMRWKDHANSLRPCGIYKYLYIYSH